MPRSASPFYVPRPRQDDLLAEIQVKAAAKRRLRAESWNPELGATPEEAQVALEGMRGDINRFGAYVFGLEPAKVHRFWNRCADDVIQRKVRQNKLLILARPNSAKPLSIYSEVLMADGSYQYLGDVQVGDSVITHEGRARKVLAVHEQGILPVLRIQTHSGRVILSAPDHVFLTPTGWKEAKDLKVREALALVSRPKTTPKDFTISVEEFRMAGYFIGDGNTTGNYKGSKSPFSMAANVTCFDPVEAKDLKHCATALGWGVSEGVKGRYQFSGGVRPWLRSRELALKNSREKLVPDWVYRGSSEQIAHFLGAYFSCDGTVNARGGKSRRDACLEFCSVNRELLEGVQRLLLRLGIPAKIRPHSAKYKNKPVDYYRLAMSTIDSAARFIDRIPVFGIKSERLQQWGNAREFFDEQWIGDSIASVDYGEPVDCRCLTIEEDASFTVEDIAVHNSTWNSIIRPTHYIGNHPDESVLFMTSNDDMSKTFGSSVRTTLAESERFQEVFPDSKVRPDRGRGWSGDGLYLRGTPIAAKDPAYKAVGFGMSVMGARANGVILDDVLDQKDAESEIEQKKAIGYYTKTVVPRINTRTGWLLAVMTRFAEGDLGGHFIKLAESSGDWLVIRTPLEAEDNDPMGRAPGESLWPEQFPPEFIEATKKSMSIAEYDLVYQADPTGVGGDIFTSEYYFKDLPENFWSEIHPKCWTGQAVDLAFSKNKRTCFTVIMTYAVDENFNMYLLHVDRQRYAVRDSEERLLELIRITKPLVSVIETENFHDGIIRMMVQRIMAQSMCDIRLDKPTADKISRARLPAGRAEHGFMYVDRKAPWFRTLMSELLGFPNSTYKDQVDALSLAALTVQRMEEQFQRTHASPATTQVVMSA